MSEVSALKTTMSKQIAAVFREEEGALEAAQMLSDAGYTPSDLSVFSRYGLRYPHLPLMAKPVFVERFVKRPEKALGRALHGAIVGALLVGGLSLIWIFLAFDHWAMQLFLASTMWKFGVFVGAFVGGVMGAQMGLEEGLADRFNRHLALGHILLAARVEATNAPEVRGILIESGALSVQDAEGSFIGQGPEKAPRPLTINTPES